MRISTVTLPMEEWAVLIPEHHPGYVSWETYLATRARLRANARPRGEGGGAAREGGAFLQGLLRCGKCGRRMMVAYSGTKGNAARYLCSRTHQLQGTRRPCQSVGGLRLERAVAAAFLAAVTPAGIEATAAAIGHLQADHEERLRLQGLALERASFEGRAPPPPVRRLRAGERLVARSLEAALEEALAEAERERRALGELERRRPAALSESERRALRRLAADLPRVWAAPTTTDRDRKELLRALLEDVVVSVDRERDRAGVELRWQGGARSELSVKPNRTGPKRTDTSEDLIGLIRRLAEHSADPEIAMVLAKQGRLTPTCLPFTAARVAGIRQRPGIPAARPDALTGEGVSINEAARELGVCTQTIRRWLAEGLLPAEQTAPHAPWRIRLSAEVRHRFVPEVPDGYVPLAEAARRLGLARQTVLNQVRAGERRAIQVTQGKRRGLRIELGGAEQGLLAADERGQAA